MKLIPRSKIPSDVAAKVEIVRKKYGLKTFDDAVLFLVEKVITPDASIPFHRLDFLSSKGVITKEAI